MSQDDTPDLAAPQAGKVAPEALALRAQPRPVTRLNRRTLAILAGGLAVAVLGATMWSLQPRKRNASEQSELYNVDRVSRSDGLSQLPTDYSKLPPQIPELGPPPPGATHSARKRKRRQARRCSSVRAVSAPLLRRRRWPQPAQRLACRVLTRWPPGRLQRRPSPPTRPLCRIGKTRKRRSRKPVPRKPAIPGI